MERVGLGGVVIDTLLGPEGSGNTRRLLEAVVCVGGFLLVRGPRRWHDLMGCVGCGVPVVF